MLSRHGLAEQRLLGLGGALWEASGQGLEDFQRLKRVDIICKKHGYLGEVVVDWLAL